MNDRYDDVEAMLQMPAPTLERDTRPMLIESLPHTQQQQAQELAATIDIHDFEAVLQYGTDAQLALSRFSTLLLAQVQRKEQTNISAVLSQLTDTLEEINPQSLTEKRGFFKRFLPKSTTSTQQLMTKYKRISVQVDRLSIQLERSKIQLLRDLQLLDQLFEQNKKYFDALNLYIAAAEVKRLDVLYEELPSVEQQANESDDPMAQQQLKDLQSAIERFEQRIYDLEMARLMTIQSAPQIRLVQQTSRMLANKIQTSIQTAIPVWKTQISLAITLSQQKKEAERQQQIEALSMQMGEASAQLHADTTTDVFTTHAQLLSTIQETIDIEQSQLESKQQIEQIATQQPLSRMAKRHL